MSDHREGKQRAPRPGGRRESDPPPAWLSIQAYADRHSVHRNTVTKWVRANILEIYRFGRLIRIRNVPPDQHHPHTPAEE